MIARRSLLRSALAAPFVARLGIIMPVRALEPELTLADIVRNIDPMVFRAFHLGIRPIDLGSARCIPVGFFQP